MPNYYTWSRSRLLQVYSSQAAADAAAAAGSIPVGQPVAVNGGDLVGMVIAGPSIQWNATPSNTYTSVAGGYAAVLAQAQADGASNGDYYFDEDNDQMLRFYADAGGDPGSLWPPDLYAMITGIWSNATGDAHWSLADDEDTDTDLTGRGWVINLGTGATFAKVGGSAAQLASGPNANQSANPAFTPTTVPQRSLILIHHRVTNFNAANGGSPIYAGANDGAGTNTYLRYEVSDSGGAGNGRLWDGSAQDGGGRLTTPINTWRTLFILLDGRTANSPYQVRCLETGEILSAQRDQVLTGAVAFSYQCYNAAGDNMTTEIKEIRCYEAI